MENEKKLPPLSEKMRGALGFLQANEGAFFCADIAAALGLEQKSLSPVLTALVKRGLLETSTGEREVENKKGEKKVNTYKMYALTEEGRATNIEA